MTIENLTPGAAAADNVHDPLPVTNEENIIRVGIDPVSRMSANVAPADEVKTSITWSDHVKGVDKEEVIIDKSDPFDDSLRNLARERDYAISRANACVGPDGAVIPGLGGELDRWTNRLAGLQHSIDYQVHVAERERQKRYENEVAAVGQLQEDAEALDKRMEHLRIRDNVARRGY